MNHTERINSREVIDKAQVFFGVGQGSGGSDWREVPFVASASEVSSPVSSVNRRIIEGRVMTCYDLGSKNPPPKSMRDRRFYRGPKT